MDNKNKQTIEINILGARVGFDPKVIDYNNSQFLSFQVSTKKWNKDPEVKEYENFSCTASIEFANKIKKGDIVDVYGNLYTKLYQDKLQMNVKVIELKVVAETKPKDEYKAPNATITPDDLPF